MNKNKLFNGFAYETQSLHLPRNVFPLHPSHDTSCNLGEIKPVLCLETMPGASYNLKKIASQVIMPSSLKHPMLSELHQDIHVFYVPFRIIWDKYKLFEGNPEPSAWSEKPQGTVTIPQLSFAGAPVQAGDICHTMLGLPVGFTGTISQLPTRALAKIYNYWYRDENVEVSQNTYFDNNSTLLRSNMFGTGATFTANVNKGAKTPFLEATGTYSSDGNKNAIALGGWCPHAYKLRDFWQSLLPKPQKGQPVTISLGGEAPLNTSDTITNFASSEPLRFGTSLPQSNATFLGIGGDNLGGAVGATNATGVDLSNPINGTNLVADLQNLSVITIDALKTAMTIQGVSAKLAHFGTRYDEWLLAIFGEKVPDFRIDEPECIGGFRRRLNVGTVLQSSNVNSESTPTGTMYGYSNSVNGKDNLGVFTSKERGYIIICSVIRTDNRYSQGVNQMLTRKTRFDFAYPPLANLPDEEHYKTELYWQANPEDGLGFSERYGSYKFMESRTSGMLDPAADLSLANWSAAELLTSAPLLTPAWKKSIGLFLDRCLTYPHFIVNSEGTVTSLGPDQFILSLYFEIDAHLPLPIHPSPYRF